MKRNKTKSLINTIILIYIYFIASMGFSYIILKNRSFFLLSKMAQLLLVMLFVISFLIVVISYNIFYNNDEIIEIIYTAVLVFHALYLFIGLLIYTIKRV